MLRSVGAQAECVVVENGDAESLAGLPGDVKVRVIRPGRNEGFGRGCNAGAAQASSEYLLFLNPDAELSPESISALERAAETLPDFVAANPVLVDARGRVRLKSTSLLLSGRPPTDAAAPCGAVRVPVLSGCALFVSRRHFEQVGGFDPAIFLYHEDHDLALRLAERGSLWSVPAAVVRHAAGTGAPRTPQVAWMKGYHMARSRHFVLHKHQRSLPFLRTIGPAIAGLFLPHNMLSARRRSRVLGQVAGAWSSMSDHGGYTGK